MIPEDVDREIERLKQKRVELANKASVTTDFEAKDELEKEISTIQQQIRILEKFKRK